MQNILKYIKYSLVLLLMPVVLAGVLPKEASALLPREDARLIAESEEPLTRRIYSYDMGIDSSGDVHIVYSKPFDNRTARIFYVRRVAGTWASTLLTASGFRGSVSTFLQVDDRDRIHICYIKDEGSSEGLYYTVLHNGVVEKQETFVDRGGWHTRMQLDGNGYPVFIRDNEIWQEDVSKLALVTTRDGATWEMSYLDLPNVPKFRIADFLVENGVYHITYGDSAYVRPVLDGHGSTTYVDGIFHNLWYARSQSGSNWTAPVLLDGPGTLYDREYWTAMALDGGNPLVSMYKYNEYGGKYATGTSAILIRFSGGAWLKKTITGTDYPNTREGMGMGLAVNGPGDYFGVWNYSPDYIIPDDEFTNSGNTALARSGSSGDWTAKAQVDPFSLEGKAKLKIQGNRLFLLALGNALDTKLYFREYNMFALGNALSASGGGGTGTVLPAIYNILMKQ